MMYDTKARPEACACNGRSMWSVPSGLQESKVSGIGWAFGLLGYGDDQDVRLCWFVRCQLSCKFGRKRRRLG